MAQSRRDDPGALGFPVLTVLEAAEGNLKAMETLAAFPNRFLFASMASCEILMTRCFHSSGKNVTDHCGFAAEKRLETIQGQGTSQCVGRCWQRCQAHAAQPSHTNYRFELTQSRVLLRKENSPSAAHVLRPIGDTNIN
jgi:hypothetical protein